MVDHITIGWRGSGCSLGVECLPMDVGLFYLFAFPVKSTPILLPFYFSPLSLRASCTKYTIGLSLVSFYLTLLEPSNNMKLLLCGPVEQAKTIGWQLINCPWLLLTKLQNENKPQNDWITWNSMRMPFESYLTDDNFFIFSRLELN